MYNVFSISDAEKSQAQKSDSNTVMPSAGMPSGFSFDKPAASGNQFFCIVFLVAVLCHNLILLIDFIDSKLASNTAPHSPVAFGNSEGGKPINSGSNAILYW